MCKTEPDMPMSDSIVPVAAGLAVGICLIVVFSIAFQFPEAEQAEISPAKGIVWVAANATQCDDPWYHEQASVIDFFEDRQIRVYDMDQSYFLESDQVVCHACSCISGWTLHLAVDSSDVPEMEEFGFDVQHD